MSTKEEMKFWEGEGPIPRNKDCVTIKRSEYLKLIEKKKKLMVKNGEFADILKEIDLKNKALKQREDQLSLEKYKISQRLREFSNTILKQIEGI